MDAAQQTPPEQTIPTDIASASELAPDTAQMSFWPTAEQNEPETIHASAEWQPDCTTSAYELAASIAAPAPPRHEIGGQHRDEVLISVGARGGVGRRVCVFVSALTAAFVLGWVGGSDPYRFFNVGAPNSQAVAASRRRCNWWQTAKPLPNPSPP